MHLEIKRRLFWYVRLMARNGQVLLTSETYFSKSNALRSANKLSKNLGVPIK